VTPLRNSDVPEMGRGLRFNNKFTFHDFKIYSRNINIRRETNIGKNLDRVCI